MIKAYEYLVWMTTDDGYARRLVKTDFRIDSFSSLLALENKIKHDFNMTGGIFSFTLVREYLDFSKAMDAVKELWNSIKITFIW